MPKTNDFLATFIPPGEPAKAFNPETLVWSEMAVRVAMIRALNAYSEHRDKKERLDRACIVLDTMTDGGGICGPSSW